MFFKTDVMKKTGVLFIILVMIFCSRCAKDEAGDRFNLLTGPTWASDSLLVDGISASDPGQLLYKFKGDAKFKTDGTGNFGKYTGKWWFTESKTQIVISSDSLSLPLTTKIAELTAKSLKITTAVPDVTNINNSLKIRMTFKAK